jgi:NAD(P)-dependent dehydrogenase (short-subunit alcohol dehydrogenase family)
MSKKVAVVTGASRGLGRAVSEELHKKGYHLVMIARPSSELGAFAEKIGAEVFWGDMEDLAFLESAAKKISAKHRLGIDLLVNNAGIFPEADGAYEASRMRAAFSVNTLAPLHFALALEGSLAARKGVVVNVSSGMAGLKEMNGGYPAYRVSKTGLNAVTRYLSQEWVGKGVRVNSVCPGWVKTDMGGPSAERSLAEGAASILWACEIPSDGPTGGFFRDGKRLDW